MEKLDNADRKALLGKKSDNDIISFLVTYSRKLEMIFLLIKNHWNCAFLSCHIRV